MNQLSIPVQTTIIVIIALIAAAAVVWAFISRRKAYRSRIAAQFGQTPEAPDPAVLERLSDCWRVRLQQEAPPHFIDDTTWNDLDMDKVYSRLDACRTSVGEEYLYALLRTPAFDEASLAEREALHRVLDENPEKRLDMQVFLSRAGKSRGGSLYALGRGLSAKRLRYPFIYTILAFLPFALAGLFFLSWQAGLFAVLCAFVVNIVVYSLTKLYINKELVLLRDFSSLLWCAKKVCDLNLSPQITSEVAANLRPFKRIAGKISSMTRDKLSDVDMFSEYFTALMLLDVRNYNRAMGIIEKNADAFLALYDLIGALDAAAAVLSFRASLPHWCCPEFSEQGGIETNALFHPLLDEPVPNDAHIARSSLESGSNASGKSTFIKALAISGIFAQTIHTCPAAAFRTRFALVVTSMAVRDDITAGESYFITEIKSLRRVLTLAQSAYCACYIDEILKGTNTVERIAASAAVLRHINGLNCLCIAATHDIELTRMLQDSWDNYHFSEQITDEGMRFDYTIKPGPSRTRNAIKLLDYMEFGDRIIAEAQRLVEHFEQTGSWDEPR